MRLSNSVKRSIARAEVLAWASPSPGRWSRCTLEPFELRAEVQGEAVSSSSSCRRRRVPIQRLNLRTSRASVWLNRRGARVLVVDDNTDAAEMLTQALGHLGYNVLTAHDGPAALDIARDFDPDIALLDIGLPVMDGYELAERLQTDRERYPASDPDCRNRLRPGRRSQPHDRRRLRAPSCQAH